MQKHSSTNKYTLIVRWFCYSILLSLCLPLLTGCASQKTIVNSLDEREANEILVFLSSKEIDAIKTQSTESVGPGASKAVLWDIKVDTSQANEAMALLNQAGLPRRKGQSLLGIFAGGGLVPSELQEKIRYQAGMAEQIASTIRKIDGVLDAEVQISIPEENPLSTEPEKKKITASVYVKHSGVLDDPNAHLVNKIKRLVAASVPGLDFDNVTVIGDRARYSSSTEGVISTAEEEKQFVTIWYVVLATQSVMLFRIIFFSFIIIILLLVLCLVWISWKVYPLLEKYGGIKELFHMHPIKIEKDEKIETEAKVGVETPKTASAGNDEEVQADRDVDET
jgi:type III secretion protein J